eukprot:1139225-Pelagomonas_calceolata.AAC.4
MLSYCKRITESCPLACMPACLHAILIAHQPLPFPPHTCTPDDPFTGTMCPQILPAAGALTVQSVARQSWAGSFLGGSGKALLNNDTKSAQVFHHDRNVLKRGRSDGLGQWHADDFSWQGALRIDNT